MNNKTCIIVCGATAVGKSSYAIALAKKNNTQIISADSRQCYKELNIGVARPTPSELAEVHHYFIASHSIFDEVNVKTFEEYALQAAEEIFKKNDTAIIVGGTGLYIQAFTDGLDDVPATDLMLRQSLTEKYREQGTDWLQKEIKNKDPLFFDKGEINNPQRAIRALEVVTLTGESILSFHLSKKKGRFFKVEKINLELPRKELYDRINKRVDAMMKAGLLEEAKSLYPHKELNALKTVGYQELFRYFEGQTSLEVAVEEIKKNSRHYAKRQITWFKSH
jgi:tRNA dimethylallyltransferase